MDIAGFLQGVVLHVGLPLVGIVVIFALWKQKAGTLVLSILSVMVALMFAFGNIDTWKAMANGLQSGVSTAMNSWHG